MQNCFNFMSWHKFTWISLLVLLYKQHSLPRPVICTIKPASLDKKWQIVQGEGLGGEKEQLNFLLLTLRLLLSLDLKILVWLSCWCFFLKVHGFNPKRERQNVFNKCKESMCPPIYSQDVQLWQGCFFTPRLIAVLVTISGWSDILLLW